MTVCCMVIVFDGGDNRQKSDWKYLGTEHVFIRGLGFSRMERKRNEYGKIWNVNIEYDIDGMTYPRKLMSTESRKYETRCC